MYQALYRNLIILPIIKFLCFFRSLFSLKTLLEFFFLQFLNSDTILVERFHSRSQHLCKFIGKKGNVYTKNESNSYRNGLKHQNGRYGIFLENQYGHGDVMCKRSLSFPEEFGRVFDKFSKLE